MQVHMYVYISTSSIILPVVYGDCTHTVCVCNFGCLVELVDIYNTPRAPSSKGCDRFCNLGEELGQ